MTTTFSKPSFNSCFSPFFSAINEIKEQRNELHRFDYDFNRNHLVPKTCTYRTLAWIKHSTWDRNNAGSERDLKANALAKFLEFRQPLSVSELSEEKFRAFKAHKARFLKLLKDEFGDKNSMDKFTKITIVCAELFNELMERSLSERVNKTEGRKSLTINEDACVYEAYELMKKLAPPDIAHDMWSTKEYFERLPEKIKSDRLSQEDHTCLQLLSPHCTRIELLLSFDKTGLPAELLTAMLKADEIYHEA